MPKSDEITLFGTHVRNATIEYRYHDLHINLLVVGVEYSNLVVRLKGAEGRLAEMTEKVKMFY